MILMITYHYWDTDSKLLWSQRLKSSIWRTNKRYLADTEIILKKKDILSNVLWSKKPLLISKFTFQRSEKECFQIYFHRFLLTAKSSIFSYTVTSIGWVIIKILKIGKPLDALMSTMLQLSMTQNSCQGSRSWAILTLKHSIRHKTWTLSNGLFRHDRQVWRLK